MTISVIGAGPAGSYSAYLLAKEGFNVNIFEEHNIVGKPIQCTGITTSFISNYINTNADFIVNKIDTVRVCSKNNSLEFKLKKKNIVMDRYGMDNYFLNKALDIGAELNVSHRFIGTRDGQITFKNNGKIISLNKEIVVGADGPNSQVAKSFGFIGKKDNLLGLQATIIGEFEEDVFQVFLGNKISPGFFAWIVPENRSRARVGLAVRNSQDKAYFENFIRNQGKVVDRQAGLIPVYNPKMQTEMDSVFLVGDAAGQVKATTGGGILYALMAAEELACALKNHKSYEKGWKKRLGKSLSTHLLLRNCLNRFTDKEYDQLLEMLKHEKVKKLIQDYDREFPIVLLIKLSLFQPGLLRYISKVI